MTHIAQLLRNYTCLYPALTRARKSSLMIPFLFQTMLDVSLTTGTKGKSCLENVIIVIKKVSFREESC